MAAHFKLTLYIFVSQILFQQVHSQLHLRADPFIFVIDIKRMIHFFIKFRFNQHERTVFQFFPDRICRNNRNAQIIHNTPFYRLYTLHFHRRIKNNVFLCKIFIHGTDAKVTQRLEALGR